jgi:hypothetical protein
VNIYSKLLQYSIIYHIYIYGLIGRFGQSPNVELYTEMKTTVRDGVIYI